MKDQNVLTIQPNEIIILRSFLEELRTIDPNSPLYKALEFEKRWIERKDFVVSKLEELYSFLSSATGPFPNEEEGTYGALVREKGGTSIYHFQRDVNYLINGLGIYQKKLEYDLIKDGLLEKELHAMTGFEFHTLLLHILQEHVTRQNQS